MLPMKKLLVLTSTFPRWKNDDTPGFVYEFSKKLSNNFDVSVLAPHYPNAKTSENLGKINVSRFRYFPEKYETLAYEGGISPKIKKNKLYFLLVPFFLLAEFFALKSKIKEDNPDIINAHWIIPQGLSAYLNYKIYKIPYIVTSHGSDISGFKQANFLKKIVLNNAKEIIVVSTSLKKEILQNINPNLKIKVIPMGIETKIFKSKASKRNGNTLIFVGRLAPEKGVFFLIKAMAIIREEFPAVKLLIIGDGTLKKELEDLTINLGLERNIKFLGSIDNRKLPSYYSKADIFVGPSINEGFGRTFVEAGLCGCALIGARTGGILDIIKHKKNGLLCNPGDEKDLAEKVIFLLKNKKIRDNLAENAKNNLKKFDIDKTTNQYIKIMGGIK